MTPAGCTLTLTDAHRATLLDVAAEAIAHALRTGRELIPSVDDLDPVLAAPAATFVTLERDAQLLGCIGTLEATRALAVDVAVHALAAAFADPRLPPVTDDDYVVMSIKVSVLSVPAPMAVASYDEVAAAVQTGTDGLLLEAGRSRSTLLPSVWPKVRDVEEFLSVLWRKAGLPPGAWPAGTRVSRYTTEEFGDPGPRTGPRGSPHVRPGPSPTTFGPGAEGP